MPAFTTINLGLAKNYSDSFKISVKIDNILDENYQAASDYNGRGRYLEASLSYNF
jgi:outer membrane cobalamin receptor